MAVADAAATFTISSYGEHVVTARYINTEDRNPLPDRAVTFTTELPKLISNGNKDYATYAGTANGKTH